MGCLGVRDVWGGKMDMKSGGETPPHGIYLPTLKLCVLPHFLYSTLVGIHMWGWMVSCATFSWSYSVSCKILVKMYSSWYLPKFLLSERSLNHMYITSFMLLVTPFDSLSTMMKQFGLTGCPVEWLCWCVGDGALRCCLCWSPKDLPDSPMYSSGQLMCGHWNLYITPLFSNNDTRSIFSLNRINSYYISTQPLSNFC